MHGALKAAWQSDAEVQRITKAIVDELGKFLRHSDRFQQRFSSRAQAEILEAVGGFSFAPPNAWGATQIPLVGLFSLPMLQL